MRTSSGLKSADGQPADAESRAATPLPLRGGSDAVQRARQALELAAGRRTPVLLLGEEGCRARAVVEYLLARIGGRRRIVSLICGAADPAEIDRRLFGTAGQRAVAPDLERLGRGSALVEAGSGLLFLENVDELPASAQRRLARLLRDGEARVESGRSMALSFRLVASTVRDLDAEVRDGRFRADLLRRFGSCRITIPSLRQRPGDLAPIIDRLVHEAGGPARTFTQPAITVLAALPWTRNIDELAAVLTKLLAGAGAVITQEDVLAHLPIEGAFSRRDLTASLRDARRCFERDYIAAVLERHRWRMSEAARALGIERANLYRKTRQLGIVRVARAHVS